MKIGIEMPNGEKWAVPATVIAKIRADYYATVDWEKGEDYSKAYEGEYQHGLDNPSELVDWVRNNMNWVDIKPHAVKRVDEGPVDYQELFLESEFTVIDEEEVQS